MDLKPPQINFLVSSAGRRGELIKILHEVIARAGGEGQVFATDKSPLTSAGWLSDGLELVPDVQNERFIDEVLAVCVRRRVTHLIPTIDTELLLFAKARDRFRRIGVSVWVSTPETINIASDKRLTNSWLHMHGFPTVEQREFCGVSSLQGAVFPLIAKPAFGSSSAGLRVLNSIADANTLESGVAYVLEAIATGDEFTVDVMVDSTGVCRVAVPRRRIETRAGEVSKGITVRNSAITDLASSIAESLPGAYGVLNVQMFMDSESGCIKVIEINARFGGGFPLSWAAGAEIPLWLVQEHSQRATSASLAWTSGKVMLRYDSGVYLDHDPESERRRLA